MIQVHIQISILVNSGTESKQWNKNVKLQTTNIPTGVIKGILT